MPEGLHKGFGGTIGGPIACGGVPVAPGDLVLGDGDGVCVVPRGLISETLVAAKALLAKEVRALEEIGATGSMSGLYGVPEMTEIP
ncbi:MAG: hypothetical protein AAGC57_16640 [Pseudomonadota bacterium]